MRYCLSISGRLLAALLLFGITMPPSAANTAGKTVKVEPNANVANPEGSVTLQVGMDVEMGDRVKTNRFGEAQLLFTDDTRLVVGPNSSLVIEAYLLRSDNRANNFTVRALGGTFRMITGQSNKNAYKIVTPTATIGVRGTAFDFNVQPNGDLAVVLFDGEAEICKRNDRRKVRCQILNRRCSVAQVPRDDDIRVLKEVENRNRQIKRNFRYVVSQHSLLRDFRVRTSSCGELTEAFETKEKRERVRAAPVRAQTEPKKKRKHVHKHKYGHKHGRKKGKDWNGNRRDRSERGERSGRGKGRGRGRGRW